MQLCSQGFLSTHFYFSKLLKKLGNKSDTMSEEQGWVRENPSNDVKIDAGFSITRERRPTPRKNNLTWYAPIFKYNLWHTSLKNWSRLAWDQAPQWGEKGQKGRGQIGKISASEASRAVSWWGGKGDHPFPSPDYLSVRFARRFCFFRHRRLFLLFPTMRSLVPG